VNLFFRLEDYDRASQIIEKNLKTAVERRNLRSQINSLWRKGMVEVGRKAIPEAEKTSAELKVVCAQSLNKKNTRCYEHLLGLVELGKGDYRGAAENYEKFLDLWKDAVTGQPEVADARARLAALG
jgi:tetratricopeptide (TPR) repeat protein